MDQGTIYFPKNFWFGCATAAHQIEGGQDNDWTDWEKQRGKVKDGTRSGIACDNWNSYPLDITWMAALYQNAHRFSLEWSRIEPQEGRFDEAALTHYYNEIKIMRRFGLEPMVTLHHFTLPKWVAAKGGLLARDTPQLFRRYAHLCAEAFGQDVRIWLTINEPNIQSFLAYGTGEWPPGKQNPIDVLRAQRTLLEMHAGAAREIRDVASIYNWEAHVSYADHLRPVVPTPANLINRAIAWPQDYGFNQAFFLACMDERAGLPLGLWGRVPDARIDFYALNFYCERPVKFDLTNPKDGFTREVIDPRIPRSAYDWPIDPPALTRALVKRHRQTGGLPTIITENGVSDQDDELRKQFLIDHLTAVHEAIEQGVDVRGYLHWTFRRNFEWTQGYSQDFGILTRDGRIKPSARLYSEVCRTRSITAEMRREALGLN